MFFKGENNKSVSPYIFKKYFKNYWYLKKIKTIYIKKILKYYNKQYKELSNKKKNTYYKDFLYRKIRFLNYYIYCTNRYGFNYCNINRGESYYHIKEGYYKILQHLYILKFKLPNKFIKLKAPWIYSKAFKYKAKQDKCLTNFKPLELPYKITKLQFILNTDLKVFSNTNSYINFGIQ